jgi:sugar fermentation stimulation protein A
LIYENTYIGRFISRPNRFIAGVEIGGSTEICHVKNTGRCRELLIPNAKVILQKSDNPNRSTKYDLVAVYKNKKLINIDSNAPNKVFLEYLKSGNYIKNITYIKPEKTYGKSRFDFYVEADSRKIFIEVKGVTLEENGVVLFPDAPTERGVKHVNDLMECLSDGYEAQIVFIVQMSGVNYFTPNIATHPEFGEALKRAKKASVEIVALECDVAEDSLTVTEPVKIKLK